MKEWLTKLAHVGLLRALPYLAALALSGLVALGLLAPERAAVAECALTAQDPKSCGSP